MDKESAKLLLKGRLREYADRVLDHSKSGMYCCPYCNSGKGDNQSGAFSVKGDFWKCFSCHETGDIFTLIGKVDNIPTFGEQFKRACEIFHVDIDGTPARPAAASTAARSAPGTERSGNRQPGEGLQAASSTQASTEPKQDPEAAERTKRFIAEARKHIRETDYPQRRGLSNAVIERFNLGYSLYKYDDNGNKAPALIIPTSAESYVARFTDYAIKPKIKASSGKRHIFNAERIEKAEKPLIVVEGEIDALSVIEVGGEALGLGGTGNVGELLKLFKKAITRKQPPKQPVIIALDNDDDGRKAAKELKAGLDDLGLACCYASSFKDEENNIDKIFSIYGEYSEGTEEKGKTIKDANEALQRDRELFAEAVAEAEKATPALLYLKKYSVGEHWAKFNGQIQSSANTPSISTGFKQLDEKLDGGLYEGLYIIGAISSLGKTTLALQIADQVAQKGGNALIFSLEMSRFELMSKSISRHTLQRSLESKDDYGSAKANAKTARGITTLKRYYGYIDAYGDPHPCYSSEELQLIAEAESEYFHGYKGKRCIIEGIGDIGVIQIREAVEENIRLMGKKPVVIIDYLQILAPYNEKATDKQNTDKAVLELKRISRDFKIPLIAISSFNRQNYSQAVTMEAFKESGAIEYSSDVLIGLQLKGAGGKDFNATEAKREDPRQIELKILKNRNGRVGDTINFWYYPLFNYFEEK